MVILYYILCRVIRPRINKRVITPSVVFIVLLYFAVIWTF